MNTNNLTDTLQTQSNTTAFKNGIKDGIPISLGYLAVSYVTPLPENTRTFPS